MKLPVIALAAMGAALLFAAPAHAQPEVIRTQLDSAAVLVGNEGFRLQDDIVAGELGQGASDEYELELEGGMTYIIIGVCDGDCSDLDLALTTSGGDDVDSDYETDDVPMVMVEVERGQTYSLKVEMAACSVEPCAFGIGVYGKR
ncbi:hypothetical protein [Longimicrobium sp.]|uniref:hypothetical protein n=1 Tax=Longimicrobium sp. TaxID=2029185 RepID=UPI002E320419|nr:hypothetical protein [Longimicrobium sp.]HEX6039697.1 hypothetical protein [Longimicrobium sp.]